MMHAGVLFRDADQRERQKLVNKIARILFRHCRKGLCALPKYMHDHQEQLPKGLQNVLMPKGSDMEKYMPKFVDMCCDVEKYIPSGMFVQQNDVSRSYTMKKNIMLIVYMNQASEEITLAMHKRK